MSTPLNIAVIGAGNVGSSLAQALAHYNEYSVHLVSKSVKPERDFGDAVLIHTSIEEIGNADLAIVAVPDDAITRIFSTLKGTVKYIVHTSGSTPILEAKTNGGVLYPFQTFTKGRKLNWKEVPICIESQNPELSSMLTQIACSLSNRVIELNSDQRSELHLVGVLAANFNNHLRFLINKQLTKAQIDPEIARELLSETEAKIETIGAELSQTGPALRGDQSTIDRHLKMLESDPELHELYIAFTRSIQATYK